MHQQPFLPKFFINKKEDIITESLTGHIISNPNTIYYKDLNIVIDKIQLQTEKVRIICGGGSGHEPAHGGFVQEGMLTAAVCGDIYSSPSFTNIQKTIDLLYTPKGLLILIKNYGGDIINFSLAAELAKSQGKKVDFLIVDDDISLVNLNENKDNNPKNTFNKRRGLCGIVFLYKILGSMAQNNFTFEDIFTYGKNIIPSLYTLGVSLTSSITPFTTEKDLIDNIGNSECEIGLGIHGEKGKERIKFNNTNELLKYCYENVFEKNLPKEILSNKDNNNNYRNFCIILNNLGSCTDIEMSIILNSLINHMQNNYKQINILRFFCGRFMSSLDMKGFSITLCDMDNNEFLQKNLKNLLNSIDENNTNNNNNIIFKAIDLNNNDYINRIKNYENFSEKKFFYQNNSKIKNLIKRLCEHLKENCEKLNHLDKEVADGDLGIGVERGCNVVLKNLEFFDFENSLKTSIKEIGYLIACNYGGTSGPLIASFLLRGSDFLVEKEGENLLLNFLQFYLEGVKMMKVIGKAELNDRTMMDLLFPFGDFYEQYVNNKGSFGEDKEFDIKDFEKNANEILLNLLEKIKNMKARKGRTAYQEGREIGKEDPGSYLCYLVIGFVINYLKEN
jgi:dihydroxyacetone kinase